MKTTIDLPDAVLRRAKIAAAERSTTLRDLVISGLETVLQGTPSEATRQAALRRLRKGLKLHGRPLSREQLHDRTSIR